MSGRLPTRNRSQVTEGGFAAAMQQPAMDAKKRAAGKSLEEEAVALCTTTWYRWKPNYEEAALTYEKAVELYTSGGCPREAAACLRRLSELYLSSLHQPLIAAIRLERCADLVAADPTPSVAISAFDDYQAAGQYFAEGGNSLRGAAVTLTGARLCARVDAPRALRMYQTALELYGLDENERLAADVYKDAVALAITSQHLDTAVALLELQLAAGQRHGQGHVVCRAAVSVIVVQLSQVDFIAADRAYQKYLGFASFPPSPEARLAAELLQAAQDASAEALERTLKQHASLVSFLDPELARLVAKLPIREFQPTPQYGVEQFIMATPPVAAPGQQQQAPAAAAAAAPPPKNSARLHSPEASQYVPPADKFALLQPPETLHAASQPAEDHHSASTIPQSPSPTLDQPTTLEDHPVSTPPPTSLSPSPASLSPSPASLSPPISHPQNPEDWC